MRIPAPSANTLELRIANLKHRDHFGERWQYQLMHRVGNGFWEVDIATLGLEDGTYEYEFVMNSDGGKPIADPYAKEITRFGGYRALLHIKNGQEWTTPFDWSDELPQDVRLAENN